MSLLVAYTVFSGLLMAYLLAGAPTSLYPSLVKAITDGVVRCPSAFSMTLATPPSMMETQELVVPKSIPITYSPDLTEKVRVDWGLSLLATRANVYILLSIFFALIKNFNLASNIKANLNMPRYFRFSRIITIKHLSKIIKSVFRIHIKTLSDLRKFLLTKISNSYQELHIRPICYFPDPIASYQLLLSQ